MLQQSALLKAPLACTQDIKSVRNWHYNHSNLAISAPETSYLSHDLDLYNVVPKEKTPLRRLLDRSRKFRIHFLWRKAQAPDLPLYDQDVITYTDDKRIDRFVTIVIVGVGTVMLLAPMWILQALQSNGLKLGVITVFVVVFLGLVSYATVAKPFETLAATAAWVLLILRNGKENADYDADIPRCSWFFCSWGHQILNSVVFPVSGIISTTRC